MNKEKLLEMIQEQLDHHEYNSQLGRSQKTRDYEYFHKGAHQSLNQLRKLINEGTFDNEI